MRSELEGYLPILPEHYINAFRLLSVYEIKMRIFVCAVLRGNLGEVWKSIALNQGPSLKSRIETRQCQLRQYGHIGSGPETPMDYLTMDELVGLITDAATKKYFSPHFPGSIDKVFAPKFWEILITRNHLMHFRQFQQQDADRLYENILDTIRIFDMTIEEFTALFWPEDLFEADHVMPKPSMGEDWLPVLMKESAVKIKAVETPSKKWIKVFLLFPYVMKEEADASGETYFESYRVLVGSIVGLLKDLISRAVYYNKFDVNCDDIEIVESPVPCERMRGLEICLMKSVFKAEEALIKAALIQMLDEAEKWYVDLVERKNPIDFQCASQYFRKQEDFSPLYLENLQGEVHKELKEAVDSEDWTVLLNGRAFDSIYKKDERYSREITE
jgi:hypothetical protein